MRRHRVLVALTLVALVAAACGGDTLSASTAVGADPPQTTTVATTTPDPVEEVGATSSTEGTTVVSNRPIAPDFTLELGAGGSFTLSEGEKPVYLVFWAEW